MELELYQAETARMAATQAASLEDARQILASGRPLSRLEFSGLQRALQVSIENAIIGLRNRLVHDYMNLDEQLVKNLVLERKEQLVLDFLLRDYPG